MPLDVVDDAMESAFGLGLTTPQRLEAALDGRRGSGVVGRLLAARPASRPRGSVLEGRWLRLVRSAGVPEPVGQLEVRAGGRRYFLGLAGWRVLHFTSEDVHVRPQWVLGAVRTALQS